MEDRRGQGGFGGGGIPIPIGTGAGGLGVILAVVLALIFGGDILGGGDGGGGLSPGSGLQPAPPAQQGSTPEKGEDTLFEFTKFVSKDAQDTWTRIFANADRQYARAPVVAFTSGTQTGCGPASSATGPFYCPADNKVYLDLSFYQELSRRFGAPGDFAWAYVVAHEIGHHVQTVLGTEGNVRRQQQDDPENANLWLVRLELQADCFAGVWAHSTYERGVLEPGDVDEGLRAAAAVGDDRLGARSPEQWTHGSSALRTEWFRRGFESGNPDDCDTGNVQV
jgi:uncharacterized protein